MNIAQAIKKAKLNKAVLEEMIKDDSIEDEYKAMLKKDVAMYNAIIENYEG